MTTLYVGNLTWECTNDDLFGLFASYNPSSAEITMGRNGRSRGFGLVSFNNSGDADAATSLNDTDFQGRPLIVRPDRGATEKTRKPRNNGGGGGGNSNANPLALFIGNLPFDTTEDQVQQVVSGLGAVNCELKLDRDGRSRGFAVATFGSEGEASAALDQLQGYNLGGRELRVKIDGSGKQQGPRAPRVFDDAQSSGCSVFVGNLSWDTNTEQLKEAFSQYNFDTAEVVYGRRGERSRGYGTVMFFSPEEAQAAINAMNGVELDGRNIMCKIDRCA